MAPVFATVLKTCLSFLIDIRLDFLKRIRFQTDFIVLPSATVLSTIISDGRGQVIARNIKTGLRTNKPDQAKVHALHKLDCKKGDEQDENTDHRNRYRKQKSQEAELHRTIDGKQGAQHDDGRDDKHRRINHDPCQQRQQDDLKRQFDQCFHGMSSSGFIVQHIPCVNKDVKYVWAAFHRPWIKESPPDAA